MGTADRIALAAAALGLSVAILADPGANLCMGADIIGAIVATVLTVATAALAVAAYKRATK